MKRWSRWPSWAMQGGAFDIAGRSDIWLRGGFWVLDGSNNVTTWTDLTGKGHSATAVVAPSGNVASQNGHPGARGNGTSTRMNFAGVTLGATNTILAVASKSAAQGVIVGNNLFSTRGGNSFVWANGGDLVLSAAATGVHMMSLTQTDGSNITGYFDGVQVFSQAPLANMSGLTFTSLFCRNVGDVFFGGDILEIIKLPFVPTAGELASIHGQVKSYWGTP